MVWDTQQQLPDYVMVTDANDSFVERIEGVLAPKGALHNRRITGVCLCLAGVNTDVHPSESRCGMLRLYLAGQQAGEPRQSRKYK